MKRFDFLRLAGCAFLALIGLEASTHAALASDSSVELPVGGLVFARNVDVSVVSEDIKITPQAVSIRYRLLNRGPQPVTVAVSFPLPDIDMSDPDLLYAIPGNDPVNFMSFETKVDGRPVKLEMRQRAFLGDKDVTETLRAAGLALLPMGTQQDSVDALAQQTREGLVADGLLVANGTDQNGKTLYSGLWMVKTSASFQQSLPPGKPVTIDHAYRASVGISFDTVLRKAVRETAAMAPELKRYQADYCIPDGMLRAIDRATGASPANTVKLQERRISFLLNLGAEREPVKDFRVVIDKGRPDHLVSFCLDKVKKISATSFEFRAKDYMPDRDLKILLITREAGKVPIAQPDAPLLQRPGGRPERFE